MCALKNNIFVHHKRIYRHDLRSSTEIRNLCIINRFNTILTSRPILMQESFWWWQCSVRYSPPLPPHLLRFRSPPLSLVVSKPTWCLTYTETIRLIRDGEKVGKGMIIYLSLDCHHQNDSCMKMGSDESHFNVSLILKGKVTRQCLQTTTFLKRKESRSGIEPRSFRLPA